MRAKSKATPLELGEALDGLRIRQQEANVVLRTAEQAFRTGMFEAVERAQRQLQAEYTRKAKEVGEIWGLLTSANLVKGTDGSAAFRCPTRWDMAFLPKVDGANASHGQCGSLGQFDAGTAQRDGWGRLAYRRLAEAAEAAIGEWPLGALK